VPTRAAIPESQATWHVVETAIVSAPCRGTKRQNRGRRARNAVAVGLLVFVFIQLVSCWSIHAEWVAIRDPIYTEKLQLLQQHPEFWASQANAERSDLRALTRILAIGSSRTQLCLDAESLSQDRCSLFNFGCAGCGPVTDALYLRRLFDCGVTCDVALIELHPAMLANQNPPFENLWLHNYRLRHEEIDTLRNYGWQIELPTQFRPEGPLQTLHTFRFAALNGSVPSLLPCPFGLGLLNRTDSRGHVAGVPSNRVDRPKHLAQAYIEYHSAFADYQIGGPAVVATRDMLQQLKQRGIRTRLILSPESSEFRSWYGPGKQELITEFARKLADDFQVSLIDAREWLSDEQFTDGHHATPSGAITFTERLREALK
jgi:hypothetical protein